ncbi:putative flippase GtrA [Gammaproteobacteria bacterium]
MPRRTILKNLLAQLAYHAPPGQVIRYLIVGGWNTLFGYGMYALLIYLLTPIIASDYLAAMVATILGTGISVTVAFIGHKLLVFRTKGNFLKEYLRSFVVYGGTLLMSLILLPLLMAVLKQFVTSHQLVPYLAGAMLMAGSVVVNFFGHKHYTFATQAVTNNDSS